MKCVFITGGSGFLGREMILRLLRTDEQVQLALLMRPGRKESAQERVAELMDRLFGKGDAAQYLPRIQAIAGDLTLPDLGINERDRQWLVRSVTHVMHLGASTDFGAPIEISRHYNVEGTRSVLDLCAEAREQGRLERLDYISTAYVAGTKSGQVSESHLMRGQSFANSYEQSKFEAELLVREFANVVPTAIHRPSVVVGNSRTGFTPHFKVLYWPLRLLAKRLLPFFPVSRKAFLDVVPVDFVADSMHAIMFDPTAIGKTFHLTAGYGLEAKLVEVVRDSYKFAGVPKIPMIPCWMFDFIAKTRLRRLFREEFWDAVDMASPYRDYVYGTGVRFENEATRAWLAERGIAAPVWRDYSAAILGFCKTSHWGKRLPRPEAEYYQLA